MPKFKLIEHTTDIGLIACGRTLAQAFANAAYGMFSIMAELACLFFRCRDSTVQGYKEGMRVPGLIYARQELKNPAIYSLENKRRKNHACNNGR